MEFCEGGTLDEELRDRRWEMNYFKEAELLVIIQQIAAGLDYLHQNTFVLQCFCHVARTHLKVRLRRFIDPRKPDGSVHGMWRSQALRVLTRDAGQLVYRDLKPDNVAFCDML